MYKRQGTFAGGLNTIKNDDGARLVINDGTFTNMSQATVQNHHVTEIKGGTFNTTGSAQYVVDNEGHNGAANDLGPVSYTHLPTMNQHQFCSNESRLKKND